MAKYNEMFFGLGGTLTNEQKEYIDSIFNNRLTIVNAAAGTGKTQIAVAVAKLLHSQRKMKVVYSFPTVEEKSLGHTTGDEEEKESKYIIPLLDALKKIGEDTRTCLERKSTPPQQLKDTWISARSHNYMRGCNLENMVVIIDEAQNLTRQEMKKILSRIHDNCTVVLIGHVGQCDINPRLSGFQSTIDLYEEEKYCRVLQLTKNFRGELSRKADEL